jgi:putative ABC transport system permease protein
VLPSGFQFLGENVEVWRSRLADSGTFFPSSVRRGAQFLTVIGRLKHGVGIRQAQASLDVLAARYRQDNPGNDDLDEPVYVKPLQEQMVSGLRLNLFLTWGAVSCLLLNACANIANLLLARASARIKEIAVRLAIGATRERIARQLLTEGVLISVCGGALGLLVAQWGARVLAATIHQTSHQAPEARIDATVVAFTLVVSVIVGLGFGLAPSIAALRKDLRRPRVHPQNVLVTAEIALSLVLLVSAGLLMQSFVRMRGMATGIRSDQVSILWLILNPHRYENFPERAAFYDEILRRVRALPGVSSAAIASRVDVMQPGDVGLDTVIPGSQLQASSRGRSISPDYLSLMGIPLLAGRDFTEHDSTSSHKVMLVNQSFARRFFPDQDPIGKHVTVSSSAWEIVGVTGDVRLSLQSAGASEEFYLPLAQAPRGTARLLIRSTAPLSAVRHEVQAIDPDQAVAQMRPLNDALDDSLNQPRSMMSIFSIFAAAALLLAAMGVYGVMACGVAQRRREIGIRIALGARAGDVRRMVIRQSMRLVLTGVALGIPVAIAVGRLYSSLLFGVKSGDPLTLIAVVAILSIAALAAAYIPSRRATKVDPASVLRAQ